MLSFRKTVKTGLFFSLIFIHFSALGQSGEGKLKNTAFEKAAIRWNGSSPSDIQIKETSAITVSDFFSEYKKAFGLNEKYEFRLIRTGQDKTGFDHKRYKQYYDGIEVSETHYILHAKNNTVRHANGNPVHDLEINTSPSISLDQASFFLSKHFTNFTVGSKMHNKYSKNSPLPKLAEPTLVISAGNADRKSENFRLAYRFDIFINKTFKRYSVDIDAHTGELIGKLPGSFDDNVETQGISLYNGTVDIVVMDENFASEWDPTSWHLNDWNAYGGTGQSWWLADTLLGTAGGYRDAWYQAIETDPVTLAGIDPELTFYHRYSTEMPQDYELFDAWDGMNAQISTDGGASWIVLENPSPAYDKTSLFGFDYHGEGAGIPGWCGLQNTWGKVTFSLAAYSGSTVSIRFVFAADGAYSTADDPDLFGWQIDQIQISGLYLNEGSTDNATAYVLTAGYVSFIEGNYRLRETNRGQGIGTFNGENVTDYFSDAFDFVDNDTFFNEAEDAVGVSIHWALEKSYDYYLERFGRLSYDNQNGLIRAYTSMLFDGSPVNASYIGGGTMMYGAGDGINYGPIVAVDVVGHELSHGVTATSAALVYQFQSGALNESFSDIFGKSIEVYAEGGLANWLLGADFALNTTPPFRSMSDPNTRFDPDTYLGQYWIPTDGSIEEDNGGVHTNSGVQNHWFYLLCEGGSGTNDDNFYYNVTPIDMADAEQIAYHNLTNYLVPTSNYIDAANYSIQSAFDLYGDGSAEMISVQEAWEAVGIYMSPKIIVPESLAIESSTPGETAIELLSIQNKSVSTLEITDLGISGEGFSFGNNIPPLPFIVNKLSEIEIEYTPWINGSASGTLSISSNDPDNAIVTIDLYGSGYTDLDPSNEISSSWFEPAYPNPFNENTQITFNVSGTSNTCVSIVNSLGETIKILIDDKLPGGSHSVDWDGTNSENIRVPAGSYFVLFNSNGKKFSQVITLY